MSHLSSRWRRCVALAALAVSLPALAPAGESSKVDLRGEVRAPGLTDSERRAVDIASVNVAGEEGLGIFVTVRFVGNLDGALGKQHLKRGLVALILHPADGSGLEASGLVTAGANSVRRIIRSTDGYTFAYRETTQRDLRFTDSSDVGVIRDEGTVTFFILGSGFDDIERVEVKSIPLGLDDETSSSERTAAPNDFRRMSPSQWREVKAAMRWLDRAFLDAAASILDCDQLRTLKERIPAAIARLRERVAEADRQIDRLMTYLESGYPVAGMYQARDDLRHWRQQRQRWLDQIEDLQHLAAEVDRLIAERCNKTPGVGAVFNFAPFGMNEVRGSGHFFLSGGGGAMQTEPITAVRVRLPDQGDMPRTITNQLCPTQLPNEKVSGNTLTCSGGQLSLDEEFSLNIRMSPAPVEGMGGSLFGEQGGAFKGPFAITGP